MTHASLVFLACYVLLVPYGSSSGGHVGFRRHLVRHLLKRPDPEFHRCISIRSEVTGIWSWALAMPKYGHGLRVREKSNRIEGVCFEGTNESTEAHQPESSFSILFPYLWLVLNRIQGVVFRNPGANRNSSPLLPLHSPSSSSPLSNPL